jgi:thiosulfate reductase cytochrome b subunit
MCRKSLPTLNYNNKARSATKILLFLAIIMLAAGLVYLAAPVQAQEPSIHPTFLLLDENDENVLDSGLPISTMESCGQCHDTEYIESHSLHTDAGLSTMTTPGQTSSGRVWDMSDGLFGKWDAGYYRYLTPNGDDLLDLGLADWLRTIGLRHPGGGPAVRSADGTPLAELPVTPGDPTTYVLDPETNQPVAWDWQESGTVEMNCFLCHLDQPDNEARMAALQAGRFNWANTATLLGSGIVEQAGDGFAYNADAFDNNGELTAELAAMKDPTNDNCGLCHGYVHTDPDEPLVVTGGDISQWHTETTGQIISGQRMSESGMNLAGKKELVRTWDVHAQRQVDCVDCHYSLNNPIFYQEADETRPDHLQFDGRRLDLADYLVKPSHQFARGQSAQSTLSPELQNTMRRCDSCHSIDATHDWLPYKEAHMASISCETCHVPQIHAPARQQVDWTVLNLEGEPKITYRGVEGGQAGEITSLVTGYEPVLLRKQDATGNDTLAPYNLVASWYWVQGEPARPVRLADLKAAYLDGDAYHADIVAAFDSNNNGQIDSSELMLDTPKKEEVIKARLSALGLETPRIQAEVQPYSVSHNVTNGEWVTKECTACHTGESRITQPMQLASYIPGHVWPEFVHNDSVNVTGEIVSNYTGELVYQPASITEGLYVLGHNSVPFVDWVGVLALLGTVGGIAVHGGGRVLAAMVNKEGHKSQLKQVYMYTLYERIWHWLQAVAIFILIFTGLIIHRPDMFGVFDFGFTVLVHNAVGFLLLINAFLALFFHLASGEIQQYLPQPRGFFNQAITQALFYMRGIFRGEEHPFEKNPQKKLNPLQQITYFSILNVLLPLQVITGVLIWGMQRWPTVATALGGLAFLAPLHTLAAWLFASFIIMHVYLTTTGHTPIANIRAMIVGWDDVEVHDHSAAEGAQATN